MVDDVSQGDQPILPCVQPLHPQNIQSKLPPVVRKPDEEAAGDASRAPSRCGYKRQGRRKRFEEMLEARGVEPALGNSGNKRFGIETKRQVTTNEHPPRTHRELK